MYVAIRYLNPQSDSWEKCWDAIDAGEGIYTASGRKLVETENAVWYFYAESTDGILIWEGTNSDARVRSCRGESMSMMH